MNKTKEKRLKYLLKYINKRSCEISSVKEEFDNLFEEYFGFHYSDKDIDLIIDSLDMGHGYLTFKEIEEIIVEDKKNVPSKYAELGEAVQ